MLLLVGQALSDSQQVFPLFDSETSTCRYLIGQGRNEVEKSMMINLWVVYAIQQRAQSRQGFSFECSSGASLLEGAQTTRKLDDRNALFSLNFEQHWPFL